MLLKEFCAIVLGWYKIMFSQYMQSLPLLLNLFLLMFHFNK